MVSSDDTDDRAELYKRMQYFVQQFANHFTAEILPDNWRFILTVYEDGQQLDTPSCAFFMSNEMSHEQLDTILTATHDTLHTAIRTHSDEQPAPVPSNPNKDKMN
jgi:hypothetical protein